MLSYFVATFTLSSLHHLLCLLLLSHQQVSGFKLVSLSFDRSLAFVCLAIVPLYLSPTSRTPYLVFRAILFGLDIVVRDGMVRPFGVRHIIQLGNIPYSKSKLRNGGAAMCAGSVDTFRWIVLSVKVCSIWYVKDKVPWIYETDSSCFIGEYGF